MRRCKHRRRWRYSYNPKRQRRHRPLCDASLRVSAALRTAAPLAFRLANVSTSPRRCTRWRCPRKTTESRTCGARWRRARSTPPSAGQRRRGRAGCACVARHGGVQHWREARARQLTNNGCTMLAAKTGQSGCSACGRVRGAAECSALQRFTRLRRRRGQRQRPRRAVVEGAWQRRVSARHAPRGRRTAPSSPLPLVGTALSWLLKMYLTKYFILCAVVAFSTGSCASGRVKRRADGVRSTGGSGASRAAEAAPGARARVATVPTTRGKCFQSFAFISILRRNSRKV